MPSNGSFPGRTGSPARTERRAQILAAAWAIATESGLGAVTLHEVARRVGIKQPSLYVYVASKLDLYDAMFAQAYEELLARLDGGLGGGTPRDQLLRLSRIVIDFAVADLPRQQLLFNRTIPGFTPSPESYALALRLIHRTADVLAAAGATRPEHVDIYTSLVGGIAAQQVANDPGGDRYARYLEPLLTLFLDHLDDLSEA